MVPPPDEASWSCSASALFRFVWEAVCRLLWCWCLRSETWLSFYWSVYTSGSMLIWSTLWRVLRDGPPLPIFHFSTAFPMLFSIVSIGRSLPGMIFLVLTFVSIGRPMLLNFGLNCVLKTFLQGTQRLRRSEFRLRPPNYDGYSYRSYCCDKFAFHIDPFDCYSFLSPIV